MASLPVWTVQEKSVLSTDQTVGEQVNGHEVIDATNSTDAIDVNFTPRELALLDQPHRELVEMGVERAPERSRVTERRGNKFQKD